MNDSRDPRHRLLAETLQGDWNNGPAAAMARRAAASVRRGRRRRAAASLALAAAAVFAAVLASRRPATPPAVETHAPGATVAASPATAKATYEVISDDELLRLVHDRPLLVFPEENGAKKIVVLEN